MGAGTVGGRVFRNYCKGNMEKPKGMVETREGGEFCLGNGDWGWNKAGGERQIPYDLTCKWNIINKINKQAKYNQRQ